jgi:hypothetical protein
MGRPVLSADGLRALRLWNHDVRTKLPGCRDLIAVGTND